MLSCDSYHSCLVLRTSSSSKSLSFSHPIQTTAIPEEDICIKYENALFHPFINYIFVTCWLLLPAANTVILGAALIPGSGGRGVAVRTAAIG